MRCLVSAHGRRWGSAERRQTPWDLSVVVVRRRNRAANCPSNGWGGRGARRSGTRSSGGRCVSRLSHADSRGWQDVCHTASQAWGRDSVGWCRCLCSQGRPGSNVVFGRVQVERGLFTLGRRGNGAVGLALASTLHNAQCTQHTTTRQNLFFLQPAFPSTASIKHHSI